ncbi:MAG: anti-sigma factor [Polaromonas sp.]
MKTDANDEDLDALLKGAALHREMAPAALRRRILDDLAAHRPTNHPGWMSAMLQTLKFRWLHLGAGVLAGAAALQLAGNWPSQSITHDSLNKEIVASHMHAMMADHLVDVASSDQNTVKQWFLRNLDYSPTVRDLAAKGFPLTGGRLDYIDGHPVAALVYLHGQYAINLYTWPGAGTESQPYGRSSHLGFNMVHWTQSGMRFCAVSDLSPAELEQFARYVTSAASP